MKNALIVIALAVATVLPLAKIAAHCEVPCGIYGDDARFTEMLEDQTTIAKAIDQIKELAGTHDPDGHNQLARWIANKEKHATNIQHIIAQYFMTQRIKADDKEYVAKLTAAHKVMVAAMKCKQSADADMAKALKTAIESFQKAYGS